MESVAVLLLSFGGPEGPEDVMPFLENVTRGRGVPPERLAEVADQYQRFGGVSPLNGQCRALLAALRRELESRGRDVTLYWGNRNWEPFVEDTLALISDQGHPRVVAVTTSAYSSYSACRQYLEDIDRARAALGDRAPRVDKVRPYWNHPGFLDATEARIRSALEVAPPGARLVFSAHSLPRAMAESSDYELQLRDVATQMVERIAPGREWDLVFQSRSGPPTVPWLQPDIGDHLRNLHDAGIEAVVVAPIGFTSDHMEVAYDLDTRARELAADLGMTMVRAATVGTHPAFVSGLADLVDEHLVGATPVAVGPLGPRPSPCRAGCCPAPNRP